MSLRGHLIMESYDSIICHFGIDLSSQWMFLISIHNTFFSLYFSFSIFLVQLMMPFKIFLSSKFVYHRDFGWQQRYARFCGRIVVLSVLALLLYPFLWAWTAIGTLWFREAHKCVCYFLFQLPSPPP